MTFITCVELGAFFIAYAIHKAQHKHKHLDLNTGHWIDD